MSGRGRGFSPGGRGMWIQDERKPKKFVILVSFYDVVLSIIISFYSFFLPNFIYNIGGRGGFGGGRGGRGGGRGGFGGGRGM